LNTSGQFFYIGISLAVRRLPRSGKPEELLAFEGIDAEAIIAAVRLNKDI
jgi:hypothetical protein